MMLCDYLAILASLVPTEEAHSASKLTLDDRIKLHYYTFKVEMCLRSWIGLIEKASVPMQADFSW